MLSFLTPFSFVLRLRPATEVAVRSLEHSRKRKLLLLFNIFATTPDALAQFYHEWKITKTVGTKKALSIVRHYAFFKLSSKSVLSLESGAKDNRTKLFCQKLKAIHSA
jgi:hypothetical protein